MMISTGGGKINDRREEPIIYKLTMQEENLLLFEKTRASKKE